MNESALWLQATEIAIATLRALAMMGAMFVPIWFFERRQGASGSRYLSRHFVHDLAYAVFYRSGICAMLGTAYIVGQMETRLQFLRWDLLLSLPSLVAALLFWVLSDLVLYWIHRAQHAVPWLWQFHSVHHATERMTFVTATRIHPFENLWQNALQVLPLLILGLPPKTWIPIALFQSFFDAVQHAELDWTYGPLYRVFVSPVFHRIHHSTDRHHLDRNFSKVLSAWDHLFGTASLDRTPPSIVGVEGMPSEPTLAGQFIGPFQRIARPPRNAEPADSTEVMWPAEPVQHSNRSAR